MSAPAPFAARYRLLGPLGSGGSAHTFRARDLVLERDVALKVLHAALPASELRAEFARLRTLSHPNLMRVLAFGRGELSGRSAPYYAAELVHGEPLDAALAARKSGQELLHSLLGLLAALSFLHRAGLCHGDVKPANVLVDAQGRAVLVDLGCAVPIGSAHVAGGTPGYLAPELAQGKPVDERTDLYALGVLLDALALPEGPLKRLAECCRRDDPRARPSSVQAALAEVGLGGDFSGESLGRTVPFVGRRHALGEGARLLADVEQRKPGPRVLWIQAVPGAGASRFLEELAFAAGDAWQVIGHRPTEEAFEAFAARALDVPVAGPEALVAGVLEASLRPRLLVVDDAAMADTSGRELLALALRATPRDGQLAWIVASTAPAQLPHESCLCLELGPLDAQDIAQWAGALVPASRRDAFVAHTGGLARAVDRALAALAAGRMSLEQLGVAQNAGDQGLAAAVAGLSALDVHELVRVALGHGSGASASPALRERGLVNERAGSLTLAVPSDREALLALAEPALVRRESARAAAAIADEAEPRLRAQKLGHLVRAGQLSEAVQCLLHDQRAAEAPREFADMGARMADALPPRGLVLLARLERSAGEPRRALHWLARARRAATGDDLDDLRAEAAEAMLAIGNAARAKRHVQALVRPRPEHAELRMRVLTRLGAAPEAIAIAEQTLPHVRGELSARVHEAAALAWSYLGEHTRAREAHAESAALDPAPTARARARSAAFAGFLALRAGEPEHALRSYEQALALAEAGGLADLVTNALLNAANARQQLGQLGAARDLYARALRMCLALGRAGSAQNARANLANLALEAGAFGEAEVQLGELGRDNPTGAVRAAWARYGAELYLHTGRLDEAQRTLADAAAAAPDAREQRELTLLQADLLIARADHEAAERVLGVLPGSDDEPDLSVRAGLSRGRLRLAEGRADLALSLLESAHARAEQHGLRGLLPRVECALAAAYEVTGSSSLADEQRRRARARWERSALELPLSARDAFWAHPERHDVRAPAPSGGDTSARSMQRVIELTRRINAQRTVDDVLSFALDAAIELTRAGRGFVLLRGDKPRDYRIKSARQMDPSALSHGPLEWSRGIAERVIDGGEPVITLDAGHDPRFRAQASVHAMGLTAVLCVPIIGANAVRGALYLDHRYVRARFTEEDATLATALAEQVAVALANAELFAELADKQRELLRKQRRVEELLADKEREALALAHELALTRTSTGERTRYQQLVGDSPAMQRVFGLLDRVVASDLPVLVQGESGTGKELVARAIHTHGARAAAPFVALNCGALPDQLLESELFGHVRGAFTGADRDHPGLFAAADGGTLFLDEIAELSPVLQVKLLRVLNDGLVRPVGGTRERKVDVRTIAASHRDVRALIGQGTFREDLFYRLCVVELHVPALRERREDIVPIAQAILRRRGANKKLAPDAVRALLQHPFPGNVRELENALMRGLALAEGETIRAVDLALTAWQDPPAKPARAARSRREHETDESERILATLTRERWNVSRAAQALGMPRNTLYRKLARLGVSPETARERS